MVVVKSQIHAGGREKAPSRSILTTTASTSSPPGSKAAGGVEAGALSRREDAGSTLVTVQTGEEAKVNRLYIEQGIDIARELYLSILLDRSVGGTSSWPPPKAAWRSRRSP